MLSRNVSKRIPHPQSNGQSPGRSLFKNLKICLWNCTVSMQLESQKWSDWMWFLRFHFHGYQVKKLIFQNSRQTRFDLQYCVRRVWERTMTSHIPQCIFLTLIFKFLIHFAVYASCKILHCFVYNFTSTCAASAMHAIT